MHQEFFDMLHKDHQEVEQMLRQMDTSSQGERERLASQLAMEILPHMKGEEAGFYAVLLKNEEAQSEAIEATKEHIQAEQTLRILTSAPVDSNQWRNVLRQLTQDIKHHVEVEETAIFPLSQKVLSEDQMRLAMKQFKSEKVRIRQDLQTVKA